MTLKYDPKVRLTYKSLMITLLLRIIINLSHCSFYYSSQRKHLLFVGKPMKFHDTKNFNVVIINFDYDKIKIINRSRIKLFTNYKHILVQIIPTINE